MKAKKGTLDSLDKKIDRLGLRVYDIEERFATKDDLKKYATKDDIINFRDEILGEIRDMRDHFCLNNPGLLGYFCQINLKNFGFPRFVWLHQDQIKLIRD